MTPRSPLARALDRQTEEERRDQWRRDLEAMARRAEEAEKVDRKVEEKQ